MILSLRSRFLLAFALMAGLMGAVTILAVSALRQQAEAARADQAMVARAGAALSDLRAANLLAAAGVAAHLRAGSSAEQARAAADLVAAEALAALARASLAEQGLGGDLPVVARAAHDLRQGGVALSTRAPLAEARRLVAQDLPRLQAQLQGSGPAPKALARLSGLLAAAVMHPEPGPTTGQLALIAFARADLTQALADLVGGAGQAPGLRADVDSLLSTVARVEAILKARTSPLIAEMGRAMDRERAAIAAQTAALEDRIALRDQAAAHQREQWQGLLVLVTNAAIVLGFAAMILGLRAVGSGLEAAVKLAERIAESEVSAPSWVQRNLAGRLTAALVRLSSGQTAVASSLDAVMAGRPPRRDLPDMLRARFLTLARRLAPQNVDEAGGLLAMTAQDLRQEVQEACLHAMAMGQDAAEISATLEDEAAQAPLDPSALGALQARLERHALGLERQAAGLARAGHLAELLAATLASEAAPVRASEPVRRIA